jgi:hypothetical protein
MCVGVAATSDKLVVRQNKDSVEHACHISYFLKLLDYFDMILQVNINFMFVL